jgi:uncharacterized protein (UPF0305 family)
MSNKILYNVTVSVDESIQEEWLKWMQEVHIPDVMKTNKFISSRVCRLLHAEEKNTYACQYVLQDMETFEDYQKNHAPALQKDHNDKYKGKVFAFRSLMEIIE